MHKPERPAMQRIAHTGSLCRTHGEHAHRALTESQTEPGPLLSGTSVASRVPGKGEVRASPSNGEDIMFQDTIDKFTLVGEQKARFLRDNPLGFWISSMM